MKITMIAFGTRGDVQPAVALGKALKSRGHRVCVLAGANFASWIEHHGLEAVASQNISMPLQPALFPARNGAVTMNAPLPGRKSIVNYIFGKVILEHNRLFCFWKSRAAGRHRVISSNSSTPGSRRYA
jgi:glycosyl transferase family 28